MLKAGLLLLMALVLQSSCCWAAETRGASFSNSELAIIERNETLRELFKSDPGLVRRAVDLIHEARTFSRSSETPARSDLESRDESVDQDIDELERANPEAAHDLFQLIKRAATEKQKK